MSHTDPIADMLTRVRNANKALHAQVEMPASGQKGGIGPPAEGRGLHRRATPLMKEGSFDKLVVDLKYTDGRRRVITQVKRVSKPGRRIYAKKDNLPKVLGGLGDGRHLHLEWPDDGSGGSTARSRRRSRLLRLVTPCLG